MKLPKNLEVFGVKYSLKNEANLFSYGQPCYGVCDIIDKTIKVDIAAHKNKDSLHETIIHELIHSVWEEVGLGHVNISHDSQELISENIL